MTVSVLIGSMVSVTVFVSLRGAEVRVTVFGGNVFVSVMIRVTLWISGVSVRVFVIVSGVRVSVQVSGGRVSLRVLVMISGVMVFGGSLSGLDWWYGIFG